MFTLADICTIAVQIEKNGEAAYRRAAGQIENAELARVLRWLADEECHHGALFTALSSDRPLSPQQAELEAMGRVLLQDIVKSQTFSLEQSRLDRTGTLGDLLDQSIEFEQDTIQFYQFLAGFLDDPDSLQRINGIIDQEQEHVRQLELMRTTWQREQTVEPHHQGQ